MPSEAKKYESYARECVRLAGQADTVELREKLLEVARVWMNAAITEQDIEISRRNGRERLAAPFQGLAAPGIRADGIGLVTGRGDAGMS
jgi:hypothetical protein